MPSANNFQQSFHKAGTLNHLGHKETHLELSIQIDKIVKKYSDSNMMTGQFFRPSYKSDELIQ